MDKDLLTQYYTKEVLQAIKECKDYEDMRAIAMGMLHKIPKPIAQVCGPIEDRGWLVHPYTWSMRWLNS